MARHCQDLVTTRSRAAGANLSVSRAWPGRGGAGSPIVSGPFLAETIGGFGAGHPRGSGWVLGETPQGTGADPAGGKCRSGSWFRWFRAISDAFPYGAEIPFQYVQYRSEISSSPRGTSRMPQSCTLDPHISAFFMVCRQGSRGMAAGERREEINFFREMRTGRIPRGRHRGVRRGGGSGETLFCQDFDRRSQGVLAGSCLRSIMT